MKFTAMPTFNIGQQLIVNATAPLMLKNVLVEVYQIISLGRPISGYRCRILRLSESSMRTLTTYLEERNRVFPSIPGLPDEEEPLPIVLPD